MLLNGRDCELAEESTVASLIEDLDVSGKLAVEINRSIIPRGSFAAHAIHPGDSIEIIHAVGGG